MVCRSERATGTNSPTRVCQPRFVEVEQQANASDRLQSAAHGGFGAEAPNPGVVLPSFWQNEGFRQNMLDVLQRSPELQELGEKRDALQARLNELTKK